MKTNNLWPALPYDNWKETLDALHMKMQVAGKVKLALSPFLNHWWNVAFQLNASGITTGLISSGNIIFDINFDLKLHKCKVVTSDNLVMQIPFMQCSVAEFYRELLSFLSELGIEITINTLPSEVPDPVHCYKDERRAYDKDYIYRWWHILLRTNMIFERFRTGFRGKSSPVNFFWGSFDLSHTRYSGKIAVPPNYGGKIMKYGENEENFAIGFWAGNESYPKPVFYSYIYPAPIGIENVRIIPESASFNKQLGEFVLDYDDVRQSSHPDDLIMDFLNSTYSESAKLAGWDTDSLKAEIPGRN